MADNTASTQEAIDPADLRVGYQVAANLYMQENAINWSRFNIMLTANTLIVSAIGLVDQGRELIPLAAPAPLLLSIVGFSLCVLWLLMMSRGFTYHDHWRNAALRFEKEIFKAGVRPLQEAELLRNSEEADQRAKDAGLRPPSRPGFGLRAQYSAWIVIAGFGLFYAIQIWMFR